MVPLHQVRLSRALLNKTVFHLPTRRTGESMFVQYPLIHNMFPHPYHRHELVRILLDQFRPSLSMFRLCF